MTTSNHIRILKADDVAHHAIVTLPRPAPSDHRAPHAPAAADADSDELEILVEQARAQGAADAASALEPALRQLADALTGLSRQSVEARSSALRTDSDTILETALTVARWVLGRELNDPEAVFDLVRRALAGIDDPEPTRLRVHPHVVDALTELAPADLAVIGDSGLAPGEFVTETTGPDIAFRYDRAMGDALDALRSEGSPA